MEKESILLISTLILGIITATFLVYSKLNKEIDYMISIQDLKGLKRVQIIKIIWTILTIVFTSIIIIVAIISM